MDARQMYEKWLRDFAQDPDLVRELTAIAGDDKEIEDRFYRGLEFGTAGMRGVIGYGTKPHERLQRPPRDAGPCQLHREGGGGPQRGVAIAYDSRRFSPEFALEAAKVLCANGIKVYLYESLRPVPVLSFTVRHLHCIAGIVITASHNPKIYNGYKVYWEDGGQLPPEARVRGAFLYQCARLRLRQDHGRAGGQGRRAPDDHRQGRRRRLHLPRARALRAAGALPRDGQDHAHRLFAPQRLRQRARAPHPPGSRL